MGKLRFLCCMIADTDAPVHHKWTATVSTYWRLTGENLEGTLGIRDGDVFAGVVRLSRNFRYKVRITTLNRNLRWPVSGIRFSTTNEEEPVDGSRRIAMWSAAASKRARNVAFFGTEPSSEFFGVDCGSTDPHADDSCVWDASDLQKNRCALRRRAPRYDAHLEVHPQPLSSDSWTDANSTLLPGSASVQPGAPDIFWWETAPEATAPGAVEATTNETGDPGFLLQYQVRVGRPPSYVPPSGRGNATDVADHGEEETLRREGSGLMASPSQSPAGRRVSSGTDLGAPVRYCTCSSNSFTQHQAGTEWNEIMQRSEATWSDRGFYSMGGNNRFPHTSRQ